MKKFLVLVMVLCLFALPALAEGAKVAALTVSGSSTVSIAPDYAQVIIGATTPGETVAEASSVNATIIAAIREALKAIGVQDEDISTNSFNVNPNFDYNNYTTNPAVIGYQVEQMLKVTVKDLGQLGAVLDSAMKAGANQAYGVNFMSTKQAEAADAALEKAITEGLRKAKLAAKAAGKELGDLITIEEDSNSYGPAYNVAQKMDMAAGEQTDILAGMLEITSAVKVTYELK